MQLVPKRFTYAKQFLTNEKHLETTDHSLTNNQLFNFSENRRPEVVFIGVNYVTFVSGYDPSANLSVVVLLFGVLLRFNKILVSVCP